MSCHFAVPINGLPVVVDDLHCRFLESDDDGKYRCGVYLERFERAPWCHTVEESLENGLLAQDCPYAAATSGYRGKTRLSTRLEARVLPHVRADILANGLPVGVSLDGLQRFLERTGGGDWVFVLTQDGARVQVVPAESSSNGSE